MKTVLTIAGSDCSGGAGIQADLKTMSAHQVYGMSVLTALTAQNTTGVYHTEVISPEFVTRQLDCIFTDIVPDAVKIGMVANEANIRVIAERLAQYRAKHLVIDPVMISTSGHALIDEAAVSALKTWLLPQAALITPNLPEAVALCGMPITTKDDMVNAGKQMAATFKTAVLLKGGHLEGDAADLLVTQEGQFKWFTGKRVDNPNTHGTGCTLSSAIACNLAKGDDLEQAVGAAKAYVHLAICAKLKLGHGRGPLNHCVR